MFYEMRISWGQPISGGERICPHRKWRLNVNSATKLNSSLVQTEISVIGKYRIGVLGKGAPPTSVHLRKGRKWKDRGWVQGKTLIVINGKGFTARGNASASCPVDVKKCHLLKFYLVVMMPNSVCGCASWKLRWKVINQCKRQSDD